MGGNKAKVVAEHRGAAQERCHDACDFRCENAPTAPTIVSLFVVDVAIGFDEAANKRANEV